VNQIISPEVFALLVEMELEARKKQEVEEEEGVPLKNLEAPSPYSEEEVQEVIDALRGSPVPPGPVGTCT
jgi:hypothetical protein